jgi:hypothetical protein
VADFTIRRIVSARYLEYQILEVFGDSMVKQQLITRYLYADRRALELSNEPTAITKRVNLTREASLRDGRVETRITHLPIDSRLVGSARLVVIEHPTSERARGQH